MTEEDFRTLIQIEDAEDPDIQLSINESWVVVDWDYECLLMLSLYHHLERASIYFETVGVSLEKVRRMLVFYSPTFSVILSIPIPVFTDNAAYVPGLDAFL